MRAAATFAILIEAGEEVAAAWSGMKCSDRGLRHHRSGAPAHGAEASAASSLLRYALPRTDSGRFAARSLPGLLGLDPSGVAMYNESLVECPVDVLSLESALAAYGRQSCRWPRWCEWTLSSVGW